MAHISELEVAPRTVLGKANKRLRKAGIIPAHVFGRGEEPEAIQIDAKTFEQFLRSHAGTNLITLKLPGHIQTALLRHIQHEPTTGKVLHVDFFRVTMEERVRVKLPLHFVGEAPAVKNEGGVLIHLLDTLEVECRASDLVEHVDVDISSLKEIDDALHARDIVLPEGYTMLTDSDEVIVKVVPSRAELAEEAATAAPAATTTAASAGTSASTGSAAEA